MYSDEKIYSIELGEDLAPPNPPREQPAAPVAAKPRPRPLRPSPEPRPKPESKPPSDGLHFAPLMILTWVLGPFSVHLHPAHSRGRWMLAVGMISGMAGLGMFAGRGFILDIIGKGWPLWPWVAVGLVVMITAFSVWARTAYLACERGRLPKHKLPTILRKPWAVGVLGLIAPGLGLLLAGCSRRGAAVIWAGFPVAAAVLLLANGLPVWERNQRAAEASVPAVILEIGFLVAAGILAMGLIGWMVQALEGARQVMREPGVRHRMRGDWYAVALMCTLVAVAIAWNPTLMAQQMDHGAVILQQKGFRVIPLELALGAHRLDPAPTEYPLRAIAMYEELGFRNEAVSLRSQLDGNLASYLAMVNIENYGENRQTYSGRAPAQELLIMRSLLAEPGIDPYHYQAR